jgi:hypothetical protein
VIKKGRAIANTTNTSKPQLVPGTSLAHMNVLHLHFVSLTGCLVGPRGLERGKLAWVLSDWDNVADGGRRQKSPSDAADFALQFAEKCLGGSKGG